MAKQKVKAEPVFKHWDDVDAALLEIGEIDARVAKSEAVAAEQIAAWKEQLAQETEDDLARKERLAKDLKEFCEYRKDEFTGKRSRELNHGVVGFRLSTALATVAKKTWADILALLEQLGRTSFIRVKKEVDKEAITRANLPEDELASLGLRMAEKDEFYFEAHKPTARPRK